MNQKLGKSSIKPERPVYILESASIVGTKEGQGRRRRAVFRKRRWDLRWIRPV